RHLVPPGSHVPLVPLVALAALVALVALVPLGLLALDVRLHVRGRRWRGLDDALARAPTAASAAPSAPAVLLAIRPSGPGRGCERGRAIRARLVSRLTRGRSLRSRLTRGWSLRAHR